eukprot:4793038-Pleurochrysis_carterae.AAC.15
MRILRSKPAIAHARKHAQSPAWSALLHSFSLSNLLLTTSAARPAPVRLCFYASSSPTAAHALSTLCALKPCRCSAS